jgi:hypothetical protein
MAGVETYGGCCPKCLKGMLQKWESSWSGFMFDACPWCSFIYIGTDKETSEEDKKEAWEAILEHHGVGTRIDLIAKMNLPEYTLEENKEFFPSLWNYSNDENTLLAYKLIWEQHNVRHNERETLENTPIYLYEGENIEGKEGNIEKYIEGKIKVIWNENKNSKKKYTEYDANEIGGRIRLL